MKSSKELLDDRSPSEPYLIQGKWVIPGGRDEDRVLMNEGLRIDQGRIQRIDGWERLRNDHPDDPVVGSDHHAILPGFVNAHHHSYGIPLSSLGFEDDVLEPWLVSMYASPSTDPYATTAHAALRQLRSGVTTTVDMALVQGSKDRAARRLESRIRAYREVGMRCVLSPMVSFQSFLVHGEGADETFLSSLPENLERKARETLPLEPPLTREDYIELISRMLETHGSDAAVDVWPGPSGVQWVGERTMQTMVQIAREHDVGVQTHAMESLYEKLFPQREYGLSAIRHFDELGILGPHLSIAHAVWATEAEIDLLATSGTHIAHNPSSNLRLRAGIAPVKDYLEHGVSVALGMDGTTLNDDEDMFKEMRLALRLQGDPRVGGGSLSTRQVFRMATEHGARMINKGDQRGRLEEGYEADLMVLDLRRILEPWVAPEADPFDLIVLQATKRDVDSVFVGGERVLLGDDHTGLDQKQIKSEFVESLKQGRPDPELRELVNELKSHVKEWYRRWEIPELDPYVKRNSRI